MCYQVRRPPTLTHGFVRLPQTRRVGRGEERGRATYPPKPGASLQKSVELRETWRFKSQLCRNSRFPRRSAGAYLPALHLLKPTLLHLDHGRVSFLLLVQKLGWSKYSPPGHVGQSQLLRRSFRKMSTG